MPRSCAMVATAAFLSITSSEEAAKSVIAFCHAHLDESTFRKRFTHHLKQKLSSVIWYTAGAISATYIADQGLRSPSFDAHREAANRVASHVATIAGWDNPKQVAENIAKLLQPTDSREGQLESQARVRETEQLRQRSLYVDDNEISVLSMPSGIKRDAAFKRLKFAKLSLAVSGFLIAPEVDFPTYLARLPRNERSRLEEDAAGIRAAMAEARA